MEELKSLLYIILYWGSIIFENSGLQLPKIGGGQENGQPWETRAVVWQWVATFKERGPPPPPRGLNVSSPCFFLPKQTWNVFFAVLFCRTAPYLIIGRVSGRGDCCYVIQLSVWMGWIQPIYMYDSVPHCSFISMNMCAHTCVIATTSSQCKSILIWLVGDINETDKCE